MNRVTPKIYVKAGPQRVTAAFISRFVAPVDDLLAPIEHTMADSQIGSGFGITALPHLREFAVTGPMKVTGVSESPSRHRIFVCRPTAPAEESRCATEIVTRLAALAYRNPVSNEDVRKLMMFYEQGRKEGTSSAGRRREGHHHQPNLRGGPARSNGRGNPLRLPHGPGKHKARLSPGLVVDRRNRNNYLVFDAYG